MPPADFTIVLQRAEQAPAPTDRPEVPMLKKVPAFLLLAALCVLPHFGHAADKVLIVVSGHGTADHQQPGYEFDEFSLAYEIFRDNGLDIDVASPAGGAVVADKLDSSKPYNARVLADQRAMAKLANTLSTAEVVSE